MATVFVSGTLPGDVVPRLSQDFEVIRGKPQSFRCKVEGSRWHHEGKLSNGLTIDEVWERVERK